MNILGRAFHGIFDAHAVTAICWPRPGLSDGAENAVSLTLLGHIKDLIAFAFAYRNDKHGNGLIVR